MPLISQILGKKVNKNICSCTPKLSALTFFSFSNDNITLWIFLLSDIVGTAIESSMCESEMQYFKLTTTCRAAVVIFLFPVLLV